MTMDLQVVHVPDCPNLAPLLEHLRMVTAVPVVTVEVRTEAEAIAAGMAGSPTLLVDGIDPFADRDSRSCGMSCRIYRDEHGRPVPAPTVAQLRAALATRQGGAQRLADGP
ncbi:alkylmercury lyase [Actinomycetes bacterium KLBMP 9759]